MGSLLARHLHEDGAKLTLADIDNAKASALAAELGAQTVSCDNIHKVPCDVFAPCALGAILNDTSIAELQTTIVAGAANNQLAHQYHGQVLHDKGILYAPDYVINAGGVIYAASRYLGMADEQMHQKIDDIQLALLNIFERSTAENIPTSKIADTIAQERIGMV